MLCISLWQPWASLMVHGNKRIETRSWPMPKTLVGKRVLIHAAKHWSMQLASLVHSHPFAQEIKTFPTYKRLEFPGDRHCALPRGYILGWVEFERCIPTDGISINYSDEVEQAFGDFSAGRYAWITKTFSHHPFRSPIEWRGKQGVMHVPDDLITKHIEEGNG